MSQRRSTASALVQVVGLIAWVDVVGRRSAARLVRGRSTRAGPCDCVALPFLRPVRTEDKGLTKDGGSAGDGDLIREAFVVSDGMRGSEYDDSREGERRCCALRSTASADRPGGG